MILMLLGNRWGQLPAQWIWRKTTANNTCYWSDIKNLSYTVLRFFALLGCWHCNGEMYASLNNENEILPRLSRYFHHQQLPRYYLVLAVITEVGKANVLKWAALVAQVLELSDEWQVSELPVTAAPSGHRDD